MTPYHLPFLIALAASALFGCTRTQKASVRSADAGRVCAAGGATFDAARNECVCPAAALWNGVACAAPPQATVQAEVPRVDPPPVPKAAQPEVPDVGRESAVLTSVAHPEASAPVAPSLDASPSEPTPATIDVSKLAAQCAKAKGEFIASTSYCSCPHGRVLIGSRCRIQRGRISDDACRRAQSKGRWARNEGKCLCAKGLVFSPNRGGCVAPLPSDAFETLKLICESSINLGSWDQAANVCLCPKGKVFAGELCVRRSELTSREICESDEMRGSWEKDRKVCTCPAGFVWLNQACRDAASVPEESACVGELNRGTWHPAVKRCVCPRKLKWDQASRLCH